MIVGIEITTKLLSEGKSSKFYHTLADEYGTPFLRYWYKNDQAEDAHNVAIEISKQNSSLFKYNLTPKHHPSNIEQRLNVSSTPFNTKTDSKNSRLLTFSNPIGLAAGFDKHGECINSMNELGFGFVEIGSVTLHPQPGNPKPRMFRLSEDYGIINRYGFNSVGVKQVKHNLQLYYANLIKQELLQDEYEQKTKRWGYMGYILPSWLLSLTSSSKVEQVEEERRKQKLQHIERFLNSNSNDNDDGVDGSDDGSNNNTDESYDIDADIINYRFGGVSVNNNNGRSRKGGSGIVGINLGKNKLSQTHVEDYQELMMELGLIYADYVVVNVSSPNTPGLRNLQSSEKLEELLTACITTRNNFTKQMKENLSTETTTSTTASYSYDGPPLLVKIAPDLTDEELQDIATVLLKVNVDGIILTNTTNQRPDTLYKSQYRDEIGGLSGRPLKDISTEKIYKMYQYTQGKIPIIGVGGIETGQDVYDKLKAGASLVQIYTGMVYHGPGLVSKLRHELACIMIQNGHYNIDDVIGLDHPTIHWKKQQEKLQSLQLQLQQQTNDTDSNENETLDIDNDSK